MTIPFALLAENKREEDRAGAKNWLREDSLSPGAALASLPVMVRKNGGEIDFHGIGSAAAAQNPPRAREKGDSSPTSQSAIWRERYVCGYHPDHQHHSMSSLTGMGRAQANKALSQRKGGRIERYGRISLKGGGMVSQRKTGSMALVSAVILATVGLASSFSVSASGMPICDQAAPRPFPPLNSRLGGQR